MIGMPHAAPLVVLAASARALAESLRRAGLPGQGMPLLAVDAFGDDDLMTAVDAWQALPLQHLARPDRVLAAVDSVLQQVGGGSAASVLVGGGFDGAAEVLHALAVRFRLLNAPPAAWAAARDPLLFTRLGIDAPETQLQPPGNRPGWLQKHASSSAGLGVRPAAAAHASPADGPSPDAAHTAAHWQRRVHGTPLSLLFCAHAEGIVAIGINRQWCSPAPGLPFRFGGIASGFDPGAMVRQQLVDAAARAAASIGLRGLCSLDTVLERGGRVRALEINPRPTASVELYDRAAPGLMRLHTAAVLGQSLPAWAAAPGSRALALVRAPLDLHAGQRPRGGSDWRQGARVQAGEPLCTVHAEGPDALAAMRRAIASASRLRHRLRAAATVGAPDAEAFFYNAPDTSSRSVPRRDHA